uniref:Mitotic spindle assembly checkpoint protein MAD1 n=1 Tax=Scleropages formosus TaxID=113540 RepID=A0A8D0C5A9_SCLFO
MLLTFGIFILLAVTEGQFRNIWNNMDTMDDETTVFMTLKSFKSFISKPETSQSLPEADLAQGDLQRQYMQRIELEDAAEKIHSRTHLLQMAQEKQQMELSHKRARIELEKAAHISARDLEREVDRNQELLSRIKKLEDRETETAKILSEQMDMNKTLKKSLEGQNKRLEEKDSKISEANEVPQTDFQWPRLLIPAMLEYLEILKYEEVSSKYQTLQSSQSLHSDSELKIKELERRLALQEQDSIIVQNMRAELAHIPEMERELKHLREENGYLRETKENSSLLKEEMEGLRKKLERMEKIKEDMVNLELEKESHPFLALRFSPRAALLINHLFFTCRKPEDLSREIIQIQQREITLKQQNHSITSSARALEKARVQLQGEVLQLRSRLLEEQKKREQQDALVRRLQKRVLLLTKERDGIRAILNSYDSELASSEYSPQLSRRVKEAEEMLQKVQAHNSEMEVQSICLDSFTKVCDKGNPLLKIEELEMERKRLEDQNNILEMRLERHNLQGDYDPSKTKVVHFRLNPTSMAKQQRVDEVQQLREECQRLGNLVRALQAGGAATIEEGPLNLPSSQEVLDLRKQLELTELKNKRLKEVFQKKIQEFRTVCHVLTGYQIDITTENQYRLTSVYAEHVDDCLVFKATDPGHTSMQLMETEYSRTLRELVELHLLHQNSIPVFLSAVTLDLFSRSTMA